MKKSCILLLTAALLLSFAFFQAQATEAEARDLTKEAKRSVSGFSTTAFLYDGNRRACKSSEGSATIKLEHEEGIGSVGDNVPLRGLAQQGGVQGRRHTGEPQVRLGLPLG